MSLTQKLHTIFRLACAMCYIGHGTFGIITKPIWCNYFGVFGIGEEMAYQLMPVVGIADIAMGLILIVHPMRFAAAWLVFWGLFTASLRPLSGEPFAQLIERAGNFGAPLLLLMLSVTSKSGFAWLFEVLKPKESLTEKELGTSISSMQLFGALLLAGHGWLNAVYKDQLPVGIFEIAGAIIILVKPVKNLVLVLFAWKVISEMFYPAWVVPEWVERGGSYAMLLALYICLGFKEVRSGDLNLLKNRIH